MARATRADVAKLARVSPSTVSIVLNGNGDKLKIAKATQQRVREAARSLNYVPQASARSLKHNSSRGIGLLMAQIPAAPYVPVVHVVLISAIQTAQKRGYYIVPITEPEDLQDAYPFVSSFLADVNLAGVVCETVSKLRCYGDLLTEMAVPVSWLSIVDDDETYSGCAHVRIQEQTGVKQFLSQLALPRNPDVLVVNGPRTRHSRLKPIQKQFGKAAKLLTLPDWEGHTAYRIISEYLDTNLPDVIWCADDPQAAAAARACAAHGIKVPEQTQIIGWGPQQLPNTAELGVSATHWCLEELAALAVNKLIDQIESGSPAPEGTAPIYDVHTRAYWRESTRRREQ